MEKIEHCPVCTSSSFKPFMNVKDFTVSHDVFSIVECKTCSFRFTNPRPQESDLGKYYKSEAYVSHTSSKKGLINFLYNIVRRITLKQKVRLVKRISSGKKVLDFGCGTGHFLAQVRDAGFNITGVEPDSDARNLAEEINNIVPLTREEFSTENSRYDLITLWHVLEHLPNLNKDIGIFKSRLNEDGRLLIAVPNCSSYDAEFYKEYWAGYDVPRHLYHFTPDTINLLFQNHGLELIETLPMKFDAYYVSMLSEKYKSGGGFLKGFYRGWKSNSAARASKTDTFSSQIYIFKKRSH